jgi:acetyl esterase/lipase
MPIFSKPGGAVLPAPDRPERIAVSAAQDAAAFVICPGPQGPGDVTGLAAVPAARLRRARHLDWGRPAVQPALYLGRSPVTRLSASSSPALILHGREDRCVPASQAEELYAGLREFGVPAEFVSYPREGHQATEPAHAADQQERILRWLKTHLEAPP